MRPMRLYISHNKIFPITYSHTGIDSYSNRQKHRNMLLRDEILALVFPLSFPQFKCERLYTRRTKGTSSLNQHAKKDISKSIAPTLLSFSQIRNQNIFTASSSLVTELKADNTSLQIHILLYQHLNRHTERRQRYGREREREETHRKSGINYQNKH